MVKSKFIFYLYTLTYYFLYVILVPYPNYQSGPPPAGFHENQRPPMNYPMRPPPPSNGYNQRPYPPY